MVLHSAQYKRQNNDDAAFEDIMDTNVHTNSATTHNYIPPTTQATRSGSIINSNSISLGNNINSSNNGTSTVPHQQPLSTEADLTSRIESNNDDNLSFGSDRLCTAPEGHVRFVNSTIRYHMAGPGFWQARSSLERGLLIISACLTTLCSILLLIIAGSTHHHSGTIITKCDDPHVTIHRLNNITSQPRYCTSKECVKVAASILSDLDESVDPCDDFYHFSCGGWIKKNPIPDGQSDWSMFKKLTEANELVIKNALESGKFTPNSAKEKAQRYYFSCIDKNGTIEKLQGKPLLDLMRERVGAWQLLSRSKERLEPISNLTIFRDRLFIFHNELQASGFFAWTVGENDKNSSQHVIQIDQGGLTLPTRDYYLNKNDTTVVEALKKVIFKVVMLLINDGNTNEENDVTKTSSSFDNSQQVSQQNHEQQIKQQISELVDFETEIANITKSQAQRRQDSKTYKNTSLIKLNDKADFLDWKQYFNKAFDHHLNRKLDEEYQDVTYAEEYIVSISKLVQEKLKTPKGRQTLDNYMNWQLVKGMRGALSKKYQDAGKILEKALIGTVLHDERWRECVRDTDKTLGFAVGAMFIKNAFDGDSKGVAQAMVENVKDAFEARLQELKWIDKETMTAAITKAQAITDMIGYPAYIMEEGGHALNKKYYNLTVKADQYYNNTINRNLFGFTEDMRKLFKTVNRTKWSMTPDAVNAYYTPSKNQIVFPAGILQSPFFNLKYPKSINYGAMGVVMGHELSHAFDDQGREFDENGNMRVWWTNTTSAAFKNLTQCMADQYSNFTMTVKDGKELNIRGRQTLGENIADNGGLKAAFRAYNTWIDQHTGMIMSSTRPKFDETTLPLPGLNQYSQNQLFFLSFSQVWCSLATPEANKLQILEDPHSPARFRVIGALSNSDEFQQAWQCKEGTPMNPYKKCAVW